MDIKQALDRVVNHIEFVSPVRATALLDVPPRVRANTVRRLSALTVVMPRIQRFL